MISINHFYVIFPSVFTSKEELYWVAVFTGDVSKIHNTATEEGNRSLHN